MSSLRDIMRRLADSRRAAATSRSPVDAVPPEFRQRLRVLWRTPPFPSHPFSAASTLPVKVRIGASIGIALNAADPNESMENLLQRADQAMWLAKHRGKGHRIIDDGCAR